jgi:hypothetical protein
MPTIQAVRVTITVMSKFTTKINAWEDLKQVEPWVNRGNASQGLLREVFEKILARTPTIELTVDGDFIVQSDTQDGT